MTKKIKHDAESLQLDETKNEFESFIYTARESLDYKNEYQQVVKEEDKTKFIKDLEAGETWLNEVNMDEITLDEMKKKLAELETQW